MFTYCEQIELLNRRRAYARRRGRWQVCMWKKSYSMELTPEEHALPTIIPVREGLALR